MVVRYLWLLYKAYFVSSRDLRNIQSFREYLTLCFSLPYTMMLFEWIFILYACVSIYSGIGRIILEINGEINKSTQTIINVRALATKPKGSYNNLDILHLPRCLVKQKVWEQISPLMTCFVKPVICFCVCHHQTHRIIRWSCRHTQGCHTQGRAVIHLDLEAGGPGFAPAQLGSTSTASRVVVVVIGDEPTVLTWAEPEAGEQSHLGVWWG